MEIRNVKLIPDGDGFKLIVYVNQQSAEFAMELGSINQQIKPSFRQDLKQLVRVKFPNLKVTTVTIMMGTMLIGSFPFTQIEAKAQETNSVPTTQNTITNLPYITYIVKSGDSLSKIAAANAITVSQITQINQINGTTIYVGQLLKLPFVGHTVVSGDSLSVIAKKYYSTVDSIKAKNNLTTNVILIGQRLIVPVVYLPTSTGTVTTTTPTPTTQPVIAPAQIVTTEPDTQVAPSITQPTFTEYRVVSGDTLSLIAKRFNTTVTAIKTENQLTTDLIRVGQVLKIPSPTATTVTSTTTVTTPAPTPTVEPVPVPAPTTVPAPTNTVQNQSTYIVVSGDTLSIIARKFNTTSKDIMALNNLSSDRIYVGQKLLIPVKVEEPVVIQDTTAPIMPSIQLDSFATSENLGSFMVSGKTETSAQVILTVTDDSGGLITKQITVDNEGNYRTTIDLTSLKDGNLSITAISEDAAGNKSVANQISFQKDTTAPNLLTFDSISPISNQTISNYVISGNTEPNSTVAILISDGVNTVSETIQADANGQFLFQPNLSVLLDGDITISAIPRDQHGNLGNNFVTKVGKDTTITPVSTVEFENNGKINKENVKDVSIRGTSDEDGSIVSITVSDGVHSITEEALVLNSRYDKQIDLASLNDGTLNVSITHRDQAGNISDVVTNTIEKDTTIIDPVIFSSKIEKTATGLFYRVSGTGEAGSTIELTVLEQTGTKELRQIIQTDDNGKFDQTVNISNISKPFIMVKQTDSFGNQTNDSIVGITSYVVGSGDTLWGISSRLNITVASIKALNNLSTDMIFIGQELKLPVVAGVQSPNINEQEFFNMGYLYFGNTQSYIEGINQTANTINVVSPSYFDLNSDGSLKLTANFDRQFIVSSQSAGVRVVPFLSNHWDRTTGEIALKNRDQLSTQIAEAVKLYNLDGVNIDIENVTAEHRDEYTDFVRLLREKVPQNKEVSVAVAANPKGLTSGWNGSYDYSGLAKYSDYLMIMAYDESYPGSGAGPIASIGFVEDSISYALGQGVAKDQIVVGVGHYGRYWKEGTSYGGDGISNNQIQKALELYNGTVTFDEATKSAKAVFTIKKGDPVMTVSGKQLTEGTYTVWFENSEAIKAKIDLIHQYDVKGLGNWSIGQDNPSIWKDISTWLQVESTTEAGQTTLGGK